MGRKCTLRAYDSSSQSPSAPQPVPWFKMPGMSPVSTHPPSKALFWERQISDRQNRMRNLTDRDYGLIGKQYPRFSPVLGPKCPFPSLPLEPPLL
jgi:hypothetical protein